MLEDWQERLVEETKETATRLNRLNDFMATKTFYGISREAKDMLYEQQRTMSKLVEILGKRCEYYGLRLDQKNESSNNTHGLW